MNKILPLILLIGGAALAAYGLITWQDSGESIELAGLELSAQNEEQSTTGIILLVLGLLAFFGGVYTWKRS